MKKLLLAVVLVVVCRVSSAQAYTVDGNVSDWGVNLSAPGANATHYLDTHTPTGSTVSYVTEDNASQFTGTSYVGPGWSTGNTYDAEAMYLDYDQSNIYLAIVTGLPQFGAQYPAGDIFFDTGKYQDPGSSFYDPKKYSFGINIATKKFYNVSSWNNVIFFPSANPWAIGSGVYLGDVDFAYSGNQNSHYVLEASIPTNLFGLHVGDNQIWSHWTMQCGNDVLNLSKNINVTPEPPSTLLFSIGLLLAFGVFMYRRKMLALE